METTPVPAHLAARVRLAALLTDPLLTTQGPEVFSRYLANDFRNELRRAEEAIADALPALSPDDFRKRANGDGAVRGEIERFRDARWSLVDVTALYQNDGGHSDESDAWTILRGSSRFEVREVPRYEVRPYAGSGWVVWDNETNDHDTDERQDTLTTKEEHDALCLTRNEGGETCYLVWDTDNDRDARGGACHSTLDDIGRQDYDVTDQSEAEEVCEQANIEDYRTNANGWPFAHNYAAAIDEREADDFDAAGFVVARHEPSGQVYAGIDGGGYDFLEAHWSRVYLSVLLGGPRKMDNPPYHIYVPTRDGLRRVVRGDKVGV